MPDLTTDRLDTIEVAAALPVYQTFTYSLPDDLIGLATPGMRVLVPFVDMVRLDLGWGEENGGAAFTVGVRAKPFMSRRRVR